MKKKKNKEKPKPVMKFKCLVLYKNGLILDRSHSPHTYRHTEQSMF
jgi:hypothetical protein